MKRGLVIVYWIVTAALFALATGMTFAWAPVEATMGPVQKIFYIHLPVAICTFLACFIVFVAGLGYLWQRTATWDALGDAAARVAVLLGGVVLLTGMLWGHSAWGVWWTWSPRLTFSLVLWLLYVIYLVLRSSVESPPRRALVSAVYALIAFLDVPLVYFSTKLIPDIHPRSITLEPRMQVTLAVWFAPVVLAAIGLIWARYRLTCRESALKAALRSDSAPEPAGRKEVAL